MAVTHRSTARDQESLFADQQARAIDPDAVERESAGFDLQMRGYSREQVEQRIAEWATAYDAVELERDQLMAEVRELRDRPQQLTPLESMSARVQQIVAAAEAEAVELRQICDEEVSAMLADAHDSANAELEAAASERSVASGEAQRWVTEARTQAKQLVDEATEESERLRSEASAQAAEMVRQATDEAARIRAAVAAEEEQILAGARAEAAELDRSTTHQRDIAKAEHERLLAAHTSQQKVHASALRAELAGLQATRDQVEAELGRFRQMLAVVPAAVGGAPDGERQTTALPTFDAPAPLSNRTADLPSEPADLLSEPLPEAPLPATAVEPETELHSFFGYDADRYDTGEAFVGEPTPPYVDETPDAGPRRRRRTAAEQSVDDDTDEANGAARDAIGSLARPSRPSRAARKPSA